MKRVQMDNSLMGKNAMRFNKKGATLDSLWDTVLHIIILGMFASFIFVFIHHQENGTAFWEDYYAKEIARVIDMAKPGDEINFDIHKATAVAKNNDFNFNSIVRFDNKKKEVIVKLSNFGETRFSYFNDVDVENLGIELGVPTNVLHFKIKPKEG